MYKFKDAFYSILCGMGRGAMARAPDCLASHACVPGSIPAVPVPVFFDAVTRRSS